MTDREREILPFDPTCPMCVKGYECRGAHWASEEAQAEFWRKAKKALAGNPRIQLLDLREPKPGRTK